MSAVYVINLAFQANSIVSTSTVTAAGNVQGQTLTSTGLATLDSLLVSTTSQLGAASCASLQATGAVQMDSGSCTNVFQAGTMNSTNAQVTTLLTGGTAQMTAGTFTTLTLVTTFNGNGVILNNIGAPVSDADAATKKYVDDQVANAIAGLNAKQEVRAAEMVSPVTTNGAQVVDGVTLENGDRVLLGAQPDPKDNVVYIVNTGGAWAVAADFAPPTNLKSAYVFVDEGATNRDSGWLQTETPAISGTDPLSWMLFTRNGAVRDYRFAWTADATQNYKAALLSGFAASTSQSIKVEVLQREDATGTTWSGRTEGIVTVDGTSNITYTPISTLSTSGSTFAPTVIGTTGLDFDILNPSAVARSGYIIVTLYSTTGSHSGATVAGGTNSVPA